jgi:hypothetical protein
VIRALALLGVLAPCACGTPSGAVANALVNTSIAVGASAARKASGDCYTHCERGYVCNRATGYCEALPCRGECERWQTCEKSDLFDRCVGARPVELPPATTK